MTVLLTFNGHFMGGFLPILYSPRPLHCSHAHLSVVADSVSVFSLSESIDVSALLDGPALSHMATGVSALLTCHVSIAVTSCQYDGLPKWDDKR